MSLILWISLFLIVYTVCLYPVVLIILSKFIKRAPVAKGDNDLFVSIVIPAYNEEKDIEAKIKNCFDLDFPENQREIVVVSDCSADRTDEIVRRYEGQGVRLHRMEQRGGKIAGYCSVLPTLKGDVVVFTDATSVLESDALRNLMQNFADQEVGCVGGRLVYTEPNQSGVSQGEQTYWSYETRIKKGEEHIHSLTSVSGTFYGIRKELFPTSMPGDLADDLIVVLSCVKQGMRVVFEPMAKCQEFAVHDSAVEYEKRSRITIQNVRGLAHMPGMMNIFKYGWYAFLLISHKLFRILSPFFLIIVFVANIFLWTSADIFKLLMCGQILFYMMAICGSIFPDNKRPCVLNIVFYFCLSHVAILYGIVRTLRGDKMATWETERV